MPGFLTGNYRMSKRVARRVADAAVRICAKRWPRATVRIDEDTNGPGPFFISIRYESKIARHDIDMAKWNLGAVLKPEVHDYLLIQACEEAGVAPPDSDRPASSAPIDELREYARETVIPAEYRRLAEAAAGSAALLAGLRAYDRHAQGNPVPKRIRAKFKKALRDALPEFAEVFSSLELSTQSLTSIFETQVFRALAGEDFDGPAMTARAVAAAAGSTFREAFESVYVSVLLPPSFR